MLLPRNPYKALWAFVLGPASILLATATVVHAAGGGHGMLPEFTQRESLVLYVVLGSAVVALGYGIYLARKVIAEPQGTNRMIEVARAIQEGAKAYLTRQMRVLFVFIVSLTALLFFMYKNVFVDEDTKVVNWDLVFGISIAFFVGAALSAATGVVGMSVAVRGNVRVANAARTSFKKALEVAFQSGTVTGMFTVGTGLLGAAMILLVYQEYSMQVLVGFSFGGSLVALFMRVGGGIFTKAADVGADLVGKVEVGIPEDDPRNPATIADNVGDNVGDCAGMAADIFESYEVTLVAAIILGAAYAQVTPEMGLTPEQVAARNNLALKLVMFPLLVRAVGVVASIFGTMVVRGKDHRDFNPMRPIQYGFMASAVIATVGFGLVNYFFLEDWRYFFATFLGIILAVIISYLTEYYTALEYKPVKETAKATQTGPATTILAGFSEGLESSAASVVVIAIAVFGSYLIFGDDPGLAAYGIALTGMGMLTTTGIIVSMDSYGPISDNANGIFEMSGVLEEDKNPEAQHIVHKLDAVGNTTKAVTKGFAIASAVVAAVSLFRSFASDIDLLDPTQKIAQLGIQVNVPDVFVGLLIGGAMPFLFSSIAIRAVSRAAFQVVEEVRRQFRTMPGIMEGTTKPDYGRCVDISTAAAQRELISPGLIAILSPIIVAFFFGVGGLGGFLAGIILTGQLLAVMLSNAGGTWDNAKKMVESGSYGGKGSDAHKAAVIGDTVGDPFKDTAGPALNPLIKVMNLVALLVLPLIVGANRLSQTALYGAGTVCTLVLLASLVFSKKQPKY